MMRSIYLALAIIQYCMAFTPSQIVHHTAVTSPISISAHDVNVMGVDVIGSSSVLSPLRPHRTSLNAVPDNSMFEPDESSIPGYTNNIDTVDVGMIISASGVGDYSKEERLGLERDAANVGDPQLQVAEPMDITKVLTELQAIQSQGPKKYCILGTRHCSFLHQQIVEML